MTRATFSFHVLSGQYKHTAFLLIIGSPVQLYFTAMKMMLSYLIFSYLILSYHIMVAILLDMATEFNSFWLMLKNIAERKDSPVLIPIVQLCF